MTVGDGPGGAIGVVLRRLARDVVGGFRNLTDLVFVAVLIGVLLGETLPGVGPVVVVGQLDGVAVALEVPTVLAHVKLDAHRVVRRDNVTGLSIAVGIKPLLANRNARLHRLERCPKGACVRFGLHGDVCTNVGTRRSAAKDNVGVGRKHARQYAGFGSDGHVFGRVLDIEQHIANRGVRFTGIYVGFIRFYDNHFIEREGINVHVDVDDNRGRLVKRHTSNVKLVKLI